MSPNKRRKVINKKKPVEEDNSDSAASDSEGGAKEIQATFEGRNLEDFDFHGIKQLLHQSFLKAHIDISQITDFLINQQGIGSVLKQVPEDEIDEEDDDDSIDDVFGVTSVLNLTAHKNTPCIEKIFNFLKEHAKKYADETTKKKVEDLVASNQKIALLINERFLNIPATICVPMLSSLLEEIKRIKKRNNSYDFDHFIMVCKTYKSKKEKDDSQFTNDEDCIFSTHADLSFEYSVLKESDTAIAGKWGSKEEEIIPLRRILVIDAKNIEKIVSEITAFVQT